MHWSHPAEIVYLPYIVSPIFSWMFNYTAYAVCFLAWVPSLNPFLNLRDMVFMYLIRPVPTVRRPLAFSPQLKFLILAAGYPHEEQVFFWMWNETLPQRRQAVWDLLCRFPNEVVPLVCCSHSYIASDYWMKNESTYLWDNRLDLK